MTLTPQFLDELRARTTLSTLIGRTVKIQRAGREWKACCPFHNEKTPSFTINDDKGFYHCFGCGAHGDAIRWMTDQRGLPFMDAVKELAASAGMDVPAPDKRSAERAERAKGLHEVMADAAKWFTQQLDGLAGAEARDLLKRRGIKSETARAFGMGYSPDTRGALRTALKDYGDALLIEAGLLIQVEGKEPYDRFRGRLMIPIKDARGRVIAFGGRIIGDGEPKYLNSPDTPLFDKGRTLYNLDIAQAAARKAGRVIAVEGYMDVIALAQAEFEEAVAPLGTAMTETQLERLWRLVDVPILCFDGDNAGQKAAIRAARRALPMLAPGQSLAFVTMPLGLDPDDFVKQQGKVAFEGLLKTPRPLLEVLYAEERRNSAVDTPEGRAGLRQQMIDLTESITSGLVKSEYKRAFNDRFFEDFGWKRNERRTIGEAVLATGPHGRRNLLQSYLRSTLYGLSRFPKVLELTLEHTSRLEITHEELLPWREVLVEAAIKRPGLEDDALRAILEASKLKPQSRRDIQTDLRFPWDIDPDHAVKTLGGMIDFLFEEQELIRELERLQARLTDDATMEEYLALDRQRAAILERKSALYEAGYHLGSPDAESSLT